MVYPGIIPIKKIQTVNVNAYDDSMPNDLLGTSELEDMNQRRF